MELHFFLRGGGGMGIYLHEKKTLFSLTFSQSHNSWHNMLMPDTSVSAVHLSVNLLWNLWYIYIYITIKINTQFKYPLYNMINLVYI